MLQAPVLPWNNGAAEIYLRNLIPALSPTARFFELGPASLDEDAFVMYSGALFWDPSWSGHTPFVITSSFSRLTAPFTECTSLTPFEQPPGNVGGVIILWNRLGLSLTGAIDIPSPTHRLVAAIMARLRIVHPLNDPIVCRAWVRDYSRIINHFLVTRDPYHAAPTSRPFVKDSKDSSRRDGLEDVIIETDEGPRRVSLATVGSDGSRRASFLVAFGPDALRFFDPDPMLVRRDRLAWVDGTWRPLFNEPRPIILAPEHVKQWVDGDPQNKAEIIVVNDSSIWALPAATESRLNEGSPDDADAIRACHGSPVVRQMFPDLMGPAKVDWVSLDEAPARALIPNYPKFSGSTRTMVLGIHVTDAPTLPIVLDRDKPGNIYHFRHDVVNKPRVVTLLNVLNPWVHYAIKHRCDLPAFVTVAEAMWNSANNRQ